MSAYDEYEAPTVTEESLDSGGNYAGSERPDGGFGTLDGSDIGDPEE